MVLSDLGARVIKIERPEVGDDARHIGPFVGGHSAYFASINRGKESLALDLQDPDYRRIFERLLGVADVLVENFRPGVLDRMGYDWTALHASWPRLVLASVSGFGQTGPYATRPAYDMVVQAMGGIMSVTGHPGGEPTRVGTSIGDLTAALFCTIGVVTALYDRALTGEARRVDVGMLDCQVAILENAMARYAATGVTPGPLGARHPSITPFGVFRAGGGTHLVIAAGNDRLFTRLCELIDRPTLAADPRFSSNDLRTQSESALRDLLESALEERPAEAWLKAFEAADLPCAPLNDLEAVLADPQVRARMMAVPVEDPDIPGLVVAGNPIKLSGIADSPTRPAPPALDADRQRILSELGLA
jgi:CoA:oxalate CoA-transferase